jgi:hypothetical protein
MSDPKSSPADPPRYEKMMPHPSPWDVAEVTSCEEDGSGACHHGNDVVADDGEKWQTKF